MQKEQQQEYKLLGAYLPQIDGGTIFEFNRETKELKKAVFRHSDEYRLGEINAPKLDVNKGCIYVEALNLTNAVKRLKNGKFVIVT